MLRETIGDSSHLSAIATRNTWRPFFCVYVVGSNTGISTTNSRYRRRRWRNHWDICSRRVKTRWSISFVGAVRCHSTSSTTNRRDRRSRWNNRWNSCTRRINTRWPITFVGAVCCHCASSTAYGRDRRSRGNLPGHWCVIVIITTLVTTTLFASTWLVNRRVGVVSGFQATVSISLVIVGLLRSLFICIFVVYVWVALISNSILH